MAQRVLHILSGDLHAGKEVQVIAQLAALRNLSELDVTLLLFNEGRTASEARKQGLKTRIATENHGLRALLDWCGQIGREIRPQIIVSHGYKESFIGAVLARNNQSQLLMTLHGMRERRRGAQLRSLIYRGLRGLLLYLSAKRIICVSQVMLDSLPHALKTKSVVIRNVVVLKSESPKQPNRNEIIFLGRLSPIKRPELALEAFIHWRARHKNENTELVFVGDGEERERLQSEVSRRRASAVFTGFVSNPREHLDGARALLLTSESEGMPTVILEAIDSRIPIVSSKLPGVEEILSFCPDYPAVLVSNQTPEGFADALDHVFTIKCPPTDYRQILTEHFSPEYAAREHLKLYQKLSG